MQLIYDNNMSESSEEDGPTQLTEDQLIFNNRITQLITNSTGIFGNYLSCDDPSEEEGPDDLVNNIENNTNTLSVETIVKQLLVMRSINSIPDMFDGDGQIIEDTNIILLDDQRLYVRIIDSLQEAIVRYDTLTNRSLLYPDNEEEEEEEYPSPEPVDTDTDSTIES